MQKLPAAGAAADALAVAAAPELGRAGEADTCGGVRATTPAAPPLRPPPKPWKLQLDEAAEERTEGAAAWKEPADCRCCRRQEWAVEDAAESWEPAGDGAPADGAVDTEVCSTPAMWPPRAALPGGRMKGLPRGRIKATSGGVATAREPAEERSCRPELPRPGRGCGSGSGDSAL